MKFLDKVKELVSGMKPKAAQPDFDSHSQQAREIYEARQQGKVAEALYNRAVQVRARQEKPTREQRAAWRQENIQNRQVRLERQVQRVLDYRQNIQAAKERIAQEKLKRFIQKNPQFQTQ